jgi:GDP-D-mannose 3',5'-epimerase
MSASPAKKQKTGQAAEGKLKVSVLGGGGFIGSWIAKRLKAEGHYLICADWKKCQYFEEDLFCDEFHLVDLRVLDNCKKAVEGCDWVFNMAADMGGMGFIQSNHSVIAFNNTMITLNGLEASRIQGCKKLFFASSACVYPEHVQEDETKMKGLKEDMAWPARPQDLYGLEKLYGEEAYLAYGKDFELETRIGRFHNVFGPNATWKGGREKAPAAFCRKVACAAQTDTIEMWGDGKQTRSFCYIDDAVEGILTLMRSDVTRPMNIGSDVMVSMNEMMMMIAKFENKDITIKHIPGPEGVRGRNSDNTLCKELLGWEPQLTLEQGLRKTYDWILGEIKKERAAGLNEDYRGSKIVQQNTDNMSTIGEVPKDGYAD